MDAAAAPAAPSADEIRWATLGHLASLVNLLGIPSPLGPLLVWLLKRHESVFVAQEAAESLNFALSVWIYGLAFLVAALVSLFSGAWANLVLFGLLWLALILSSLVFSIIGGVRASEGKPYRYPFNIRLIRP
jgi:uncharacterized Tic20 family protein